MNASGGSKCYESLISGSNTIGVFKICIRILQSMLVSVIRVFRVCCDITTKGLRSLMIWPHSLRVYWDTFPKSLECVAICPPQVFREWWYLAPKCTKSLKYSLQSLWTNLRKCWHRVVRLTIFQVWTQSGSRYIYVYIYISIYIERYWYVGVCTTMHTSENVYRYSYVHICIYTT